MKRTKWRSMATVWRMNGPAFKAGDVERARRINERLVESFTFETGDDAPNPLPTKAMMQHLGFAVGDARLPMGPAPEFVHDRAKQVFANLVAARRG